jgi:pyruvate-formate lyase-activating enzyme
MPQFITKPKSMYDNPDAKLAGLACKVPFIHIEIHNHGQVSACCHTWLPKWVGNLLTESAEDVINNLERKRIQDNMRQGNFDDCNDQCPQLNSLLHGSDNHWSIIPIVELDHSIKHSTIQIGFSYDPSCNLQCPSCRTKLIVWDPENPADIDGQRIKKIHDNVKRLVDLLLEDGKRVNLNITGSGDAFASPLYWSYLEELASKPVHKNLLIDIKTNGVMMTEENWNKIKPLWPSINYVEVSVDAATEDVYKIVRKNGNFKKLKRNLEVFDQLVLDKKFPNLQDWQTNFIVQRDNFRDLKEFVEWQLTFKSKPKVWTNLLAQWYHMNEIQFNGMAVWKEGHPDRQLLVEMMKDPIFKNRQLKLGNLTSMLPND